MIRRVIKGYVHLQSFMPNWQLTTKWDDIAKPEDLLVRVFGSVDAARYALGMNGEELRKIGLISSDRIEADELATVWKNRLEHFNSPYAGDAGHNMTKGEELLNARHYGWLDKIDVNKKPLCILQQLYGSLLRGAEELGLNAQGVCDHGLSGDLNQESGWKARIEKARVKPDNQAARMVRYGANLLDRRKLKWPTMIDRDAIDQDSPVNNVLALIFGSAHSAQVTGIGVTDVNHLKAFGFRMEKETPGLRGAWLNEIARRWEWVDWERLRNRHLIDRIQMGIKRLNEKKPDWLEKLPETNWNPKRSMIQRVFGTSQRGLIELDLPWSHAHAMALVAGDAEQQQFSEAWKAEVNLLRAKVEPKNAWNEGEAIEAAAKMLDNLLPGWVEQIDLKTLSQNHGDKCILGQLFGTYQIGLSRLKIGPSTQLAVAFSGEAHEHRSPKKDKWVDEIKSRIGPDSVHINPCRQVTDAMFANTLNFNIEGVEKVDTLTKRIRLELKRQLGDGVDDKKKYTGEAVGVMMDMLTSLNIAVQQAGGGGHFGSAALRKMSVMELMEHLAPNGIRFVYEEKKCLHAKNGLRPEPSF